MIPHRIQYFALLGIICRAFCSSQGGTLQCTYIHRWVGAQSRSLCGGARNDVAVATLKESKQMGAYLEEKRAWMK